MKSNPFIIAEIGQAHDGSIGIAHSFIDALADTGVDAIKFQVHIADAERSIHEKFRTNFSYQDKTRFDYWKRMEFTKVQWEGLKQHCDNKGIEFMASPFSVKAFELLEKIGVKRYKIGSGEARNHLLLERISKTQKPIILSTGLTNQDDLEKTYSFLKNNNCEFSFLQCTTSYPTKPENWNLQRIKELKEKFNIPVGFSDHSGEVYACLAATAIGAEILEFHVAFDKQMFGPDAKSSLTINQVFSLVKGVREISLSLNHPEENKELENLRTLFGKSLASNKSLQKGHQITSSDLETKKPASLGICPTDYLTVIGKKLNKDIEEGQFINYLDLQ